MGTVLSRDRPVSTGREVVSSSAKALASSAGEWRCSGCGRAWHNYSPWTYRDQLRDFPRFLREYWADTMIRWFPIDYVLGVACTVFSAPVWIVYEAARGPRCPACDARLVELLPRCYESFTIDGP